MNKYISNIQKQTRKHRTLIKNFSYLSILRIFNLVLPLITYPYLIRVLGKETYGLVVFAQAIIGYLVILVGFGFNISATKEISIYRENKEKLSEIVSSVLILKTGLFLFSILILIGLIFFIPLASEQKMLFALTLWMCLYDVIFPMWYFQGIEQMKYITYLTLISRLTFLGLIFVFIHTPDDYLFIPIINGIGALLAGISSLIVMFGKHRIKFRLYPYSTLLRYLKESFPIFLSNISVRLYVSTNKVIVGAFLGMTEVAYYDLAEKIVNVLRIPQSILSQALFPKISKEKNINFIKQIFKYSLLLNLIIFVGLLIGGRYIVLFLGGQEMTNAVLVLNILAITIPIVAMSNIFGVQLLIPFNHHKTFSKVVILSGFLYLLLATLIWISVGFSIINISLMTVLTELFVTSAMFYYCKKYKLWR